jgi:outer membrane protein assembly factor BamC
MTIRNFASLFQSRTKLGGLACAMLLASVSGCSVFSSSSESITGTGPVGYKSDREVKSARGLEVPPDLTQLQKENRYSLPANQGSASASEYMQQQQKSQPAMVAVQPQQAQDMRIERQGDQRWLVVDQAPAAVWPEIKRFWQEAGFTLETDMPQVGIMETDWAENRAKIEDDFIRRSLGKILDSFYSTGERDKFRTRLERRPDGGTEIFVTHRGLEEVLVGSDNDQTRWTNRPSDPELEAEFLARLMVFLGADKQQAKQAVVGSAQTKVQERARLVQQGDQPYVELNEGFDRAWRRIGLALDRTGFTVEDRNRAEGVYYVRYVDQEDEAQRSSKGFFSGWFSSDSEKKAMQYRIVVKGNEARSQVSVLSGDGSPERSRTGERILGLLQEQLK